MANEFVARNGIIALDNSAITGSLNVSGGITGSLFGTASFSNTASFVNPLRQDVIITGSLSVSGSILLNGTGSIIGSGSTNYLSKFTGTTALGNSQIFDNGTSVGIGTTSPTSYTNFTTLSINNATAGGLIDLLQNGTSNFRILTSTTSNMLNGVGNIPMVFHTNGTEKMRITAAGRLLIGTTTESTYLLDVNGTARVSGTALFTGNIGGNAWNYDSGNVRWVFGTATDQLSRFYTIQNAWTTTAATLAVRNIASQTANSLQIENSSSTVLSGFNASGSLFINKTTANATLDVNGPTIITGSLTVTQGITGSLLGTASLATTASNALTASFVQNAISASFASTASFVTTAQTASFVQNAVSASFASTASSADNFLVRGTLTAQTIVAQTITSSTDFVTGSTRFGSLSSNTHQFTGSVSITGSLTANGNTTISGSTVITGSLLISTGSLSDFLRTSNAGVTNFRISSSGYPVWGVPGFNVVSVPGATWTPTVTWDGTNVQWGDTRANRSIMTPGIGGGYVTVPNITFINATYTTQVNNLFGNSFIVNNNNITSTLGTINMIIQATGSQTGNMLQFRNGAGSVLSGVDASGSLFINKTTANARLDVNGPTIISGSLTVFTGSAVELQVTNTGVRIGNIITDAHTVTGSFNVSGSVTATGSVNIAGGVSASGNIYQGGTGNASTVLASNGNTALVTISSTGATINMGRLGAVSLLANSTDGGIVMNDGAYLGVSSGTLRIGSNLAANNVVIGNFANSTATINGNTTISGSLTVFTGSAVEFQVTNTGVKIGNIITDVHTVTGSLNISGSVTATNFTGSLFGTASWANNATTASYVLNAVSASFASTASTANNGFTIGITQTYTNTVASSVVGSNNVFTQTTGSYTSAFYKYTVSNGANARSGEVIAVWNGSSAQYTDYSTLDIGSTSGVTPSVSVVGSDILFNITTGTSGWRLKSTVTYL
jgi:hypothetical protein